MPPGASNAAHQPFAQAQAGLVDRGLFQPLGRAKLKRFGVAEQIDRADLRPHQIGDVMGDLVKTVLSAAGRRRCLAQPQKRLAQITVLAFGHDPQFNGSGPGSDLFQFKGIMQCLHGQFHIFAVDQHRKS